MDRRSDQSPSPQQLELVQRLFVRSHMELRGMLLGILPDFAAVDDVLQETFLTVSRKAAEFQAGSNFSAWAATVARFHALDWRRKQGRQYTGLSEVVIEQLCSHPLAIGEEGQADRELGALEICLQSLPPKARQAIELRYRDGHRPAEIARRMGWTVDAIYVSLSRARAALRTCIEKRLSPQGGAG